jgi:phage gp29-like protein
MPGKAQGGWRDRAAIVTGDYSAMKLYDAFGREVDTARLREEQAAPTMTGIRNIYSVMHPAAGLTPERLAEILRDAESGDPFLYLELAEEMEEKDLHYLAVLSTRKQAATQLRPFVRAASDSAEDARAADLVRDVLSSGALMLESVLFDMLDALGKGYSATEIIWDTSGREWFPMRLVWRDPRWFMFDWVSGEELLVRALKGEGPVLQAPAEGLGLHFRGKGMRGGLGAYYQPLTEPLVPFKFVVHVAKAKAGLPVRGGLARAAGWAYLFKNYLLKDWVTFAEVFGQPLRVGKYGAGASEQDKQTLLQAVANIGTDAAAIIPESMMIEFIESSRSGSAELYHRFCEYLDAQVSKAVLGQTLTTEMPHGSAGSRAAAQVHDSVRRDILTADVRRLQATLDRDLVRPIVDLNFGPRRNYPHIEFELPDDSDLRAFADIVAMLADRGLRVGQKAVLERLGIPAPEDGEPVLSPAQTGRAAAPSA